MKIDHERPETWHLGCREDQEEILRELCVIVASPHFCNSKRYPALLEYIVENTLAGRSELLKERTLGVEVFGRSPTYDTSSDTVVRYTAGEVRKRLLLYYSEHGRSSRIQISLPPGSYVPEFLPRHSTQDGTQSDAEAWAAHVHDGDVIAHADGGAQEWGQASPPVAANGAVDRVHAASLAEFSAVSGTSHKRLFLLAMTAMLVLASIGAAWWWRSRSLQPQTALDAFWAPVLRDQRTVLICTGSVVFAQNNYSGVITAGKDIDYTFVSMQVASAIAQVSDAVEHSGTTTRLVFSSSTPLTDLREHSVVLLGAYNNKWTLRLLDPLRFHFSQGPDEALLDRKQPQAHWERDQSLPYSSADDYAVVARFHDPTLDGWVVALAGLGRNGTGAAAHFATSPRYMQLLRDQIGSGFSDRNIEVVLKVKVIDGKTGAPSILAVHTW